MLTEQDFEEIIRENVYADEDGVARTEAYVGGLKEAAKCVHNQHIAECERLMEIAFNAGKKTQNYDPDDVDTFTIPKFETFQDFKDSLNV